MQRRERKSNRIQMRQMRRRILPIWILLAIAQPGAQIVKHTFDYYSFGMPGSAPAKVCDKTRTFIMIFWFKTGTSIAFNIQGSTTANQFIPDTSNNKQYTLLQRGSSSCHMPDPSYTGWLFLAILIKRHPTLPATCQASHVITTSHLVTCSGSPTPLETYAQVSIGTYDQVGQSAVFTWPAADLTNDFLGAVRINVEASFNENSVDEDFVEFLLLKGYRDFSKRYYAAFDIDELDYRRQAYQAKDGLILTAKTFVERNTWDGLRGFYLVPDPADPYGVYRESLGYAYKAFMTKTTAIHFYLPKANLMTSNDVLLVSIDTEPLDPSSPTHTLKKLNYKVKFRGMFQATKSILR